MQSAGTIKIGTRGSPLALTQVEMVRRALARAHPDLQTEVVVIKTSGDWRPEDGEARLSAEEGGKGLFAKEIEQALLAGKIDAAVHSMKDMESVLPQGLTIAHMLPREDARDVLIVSDPAAKISSLDDLPQGARVGTASVRREAILKSLRPDLEIVPLRGNVHTRIEKCRSGQVDATLLAYAGLKRLGLEHEIACIFETDQMVPSAGQGAVGIETRSDDKNVMAIFDRIACNSTLKRITAERSVLKELDGSCHTPIGVYADFEDDLMHLSARIWSLDGMRTFSEIKSAKIESIGEAAAFGEAAGKVLKAKTPDEILKFILPEGA